MRVHELVAESARKLTESPSVRTFATSLSGNSSPVDTTNRSTLHRLERRREQLIDELEWHRQLLEQCTTQLEQHMPSIRSKVKDTFHKAVSDVRHQVVATSAFQEGAAGPTGEPKDACSPPASAAASAPQHHRDNPMPDTGPSASTLPSTSSEQSGVWPTQSTRDYDRSTLRLAPTSPDQEDKGAPDTENATLGL